MKILKELREEKGLTQAELGKILGVGATCIGKYERGEREPSFSTLKEMCDYFEVSAGYLLDFEN